MTTTRLPPLPRMYAQLADAARRTGRDQQLELPRGARLCVRIVDDVTTLSIARRGKPVGDTELQTFRLACQIPAEATRWPADGQHQRPSASGPPFYQIVYRWKTIADEVVHE